MNVLNDFLSSFEFRLVATEAERQRAYALRHAVFRRELDYQMTEDADLRLESDLYDQKSLMVMLEHKRSGLSAGCMRMVPALGIGPAHLQRLPLEEHCTDSLTHPQLHPQKLPREKVCEISRLAVPAYFRHRSQKQHLIDVADATHPSFSPDEARTFPLIGISLFLAATALVGLTGHYHVFAMMESRLPRLLAIQGLRFQRVGELTVFHGKRHAFYIDQRQAVIDMQPTLAALYRHVEETLTRQYHQKVLSLDSVTFS
ncbi:GNAT family N-acetyltransferase [Halomonas sp. McH1-25]|uniref:PEP-CTERM/exosortase system-associated acyltransferase n=1 Tax=unclassified Halomonas TaxID=2609666 RepID=UPI001EF6FC86|nr:MULTISPECIES: PEP-CTERM/exosortase system-associated acyltransferase [unclassified Halomonas]MCG7599359.1 GNAT family N-acetyltransferase [Halomonas sp. McH1-25]MCP1343815.1 GNAT family N-acetyltransferase [Halomonas sp. FL8]MCP1361140.1 GNAT family N-acetyltransferase [Halomonas sp. BBD45]MCP1363911.1 GNAT family N-acetyltransferase [Halomonas sp. BBD48]